MLIDWFTVGAQAVNFIVLVWLLKRFLYKPILSAIDTREKRIATQMTAAALQKDEAQREREDFDERSKQFGKERDALMAKAVLEVEAERKRLLDDARTLADALLTEQKSAAHESALALADRLQQLIATEAFEVARRALADLASADLEERMAEVFAYRLRRLMPESKTALDAALKAQHSSALVRSRFELGTKAQATIRTALQETFSASVALSFETAPATLCGIELSVGGQRVSWDIAEYLNSLAVKIEALLRADGPAHATAP